MLTLKGIKKDYLLKGQEPVHALKGINLSFRKSEFVSILGPSGCGKTTLLNIIGGLDHYSDGDLVIKGRSTKNYKDLDWDTYRNHSVGFVFQSYNLISHQSILKNVELALTIYGISRQERKERAEKALELVGLGGLGKKKPNQLSGGQMQRVAIARALVNDPEILLADEPTGALDSKTSVQIMDLLKEVAKDRLVIMVTHNPDLAEEYSTRIINLKDGLVVSDSNLYLESEEKQEKYENPVDTPAKDKKSSMSFWTATSLSFSNLLTKLKRSILVAIAGSIGIIGISSVLSVSFGVNNYIASMQDDMLSQYPLTISESAIDTSSLISGLSSWDAKDIAKFDLSTSIGLDSMISYLMTKYKDFTSVKTNDINQDLIDFIESSPEGSISAKKYNYGVDPTNNIFTKFTRWSNVDASNHSDNIPMMMSLNGLTQMYISSLKTVEGFSEYAMFVDLFTNFMKELPDNKDYILNQYDLVGEKSRFPENENEIMIVVDENQTLTDLVYAQMGFYTEDQFINIARKAIQDNNKDLKPEEKKEYDYPKSFTFDEVLGKELVYYPHDKIYSYKTYAVTEVKFSISIPDSEGNITKYDFNLNYNPTTDSLDGYLTLDKTSVSCIFTRVGEKPSGPHTELELVNGEWSMTIGETTMKIKLAEESGNKNLYVWAEISPYPPGYYPMGTYQSSYGSVTGYMYDADASSLTDGTKIKISGILKKKANVKFGSLSRGVYYNSDFVKKYMSDNVTSQIVSSTDTTQPGIKYHIQTNTKDRYNAYVTYKYSYYKNGDAGKPIENVQGIAYCLNTDQASSLASMMTTSGTTTSDINKAYLRSLCGQATKYVKDAEGKATGELYFADLPVQISLYPKDFTAKDSLTKHLDTWNKEGDIVIKGKVLPKAQRAELTYVDTIQMIVNVINTLILAITIALIAFTSLSLIVSCFMIAVITYISTMERVKEIGIIRSLGGRKKDISRLFIAECLITGLASGVFGIIVTYTLQIILNIAVNPLVKFAIAALPFFVALIMIALSILLNVISGLIPSMKASKQDPVVALRTE